MAGSEGTVWVVQRRRSLGFALETPQSLWVLCYVIGQELESDKATEVSVLGLVDHTHATATEFLDDAVVRDGLADHGATPMLCGRLGQVNEVEGAGTRRSSVLSCHALRPSVFSRRAVDSALRAESKETAALWQINAALREAELGNVANARQGAAAALALSSGRDVKLVSALVFARSNDASRAKALIDELDKNYGTNTMLRLYWLPTIKAAIELNRDNSSQALVDLEAAAPYDLGTVGTFISDLYPCYVRGQANLFAHNGTAAVTEFQKLLDHPGIVGNFVTGALAHLQIGRAYAMQGDAAKAKIAYQDFLTLWKDADPDIPILKEAKAEYAKLQ